MSNGSRYSDAVKLTHRTLELLKYIGGCNEHGRPTGEGINVELVLMPDLVLDFRPRYLNDLSRSTCSAGGRAGRAACALFNLQSDEDHLFRCRLLTRTGSFGTLLLSNELAQTKANRIFESECRPFVLLRDGEPRCAIRYLLDNQGQLVLGQSTPSTISPERIQSSDLQEDSELSFDRIKKNSMLENALRRANTIYFSSLRGKEYLTLLQDLVAYLRNSESRASFFLDLTQSDTPPPEPVIEDAREYLLTDAFRELCGNVFAPEKVVEHFSKHVPGEFKEEGDSALEVVSRALNVNLVAYGDKQRVHVFSSGKPLLELDEPDVDFSKEDIPERFKAGVLLAHSVRNALEDIRGDDPDLYERLRAEWKVDSDKDFWTHVINYGLALAAAPPEPPNDFASFRTLCEYTGIAKPDFFPREGEFDSESFDAVGNMSAFFTGIDLYSQREDIIKFSGYRRTGRFDKEWRPYVCRTPRPECSRCEQRALGEDARAAVLIDLDGTLLDSTEQRNRCLRPVMERIANSEEVVISTCALDSQNDTADQILAVFQKYVYDLWPLYYVWGYGDFRQEWNCEGWYVTLIALLTNHTLYEEFAGIESQCRRGETIDRDQLEDAANEKLTLRETFGKEFAKVSSDHRLFISNLGHLFSEVRMALFKEANDLLQTLDQMPGINVYIVSEGHPNTQWMKLQNTGLAPACVSRDRLLTTGEAAQPDTLLGILDKAKRELSERQSALKREDGTLSAMYDLAAHFEHELRIQKKLLGTWAWGKIDEFLEQQRDSIAEKQAGVRKELEVLDHRADCLNCLKVIVRQMREKRLVTFYAAVFRAILREPGNPRPELTSWRKLIREAPVKQKMKFVMIGDRQVNDMLPPMELLSDRHILTIRLRSDKYADEEPSSGKLTPAYDCKTLAQAKVILASGTAWEKTACTVEPPFFNCAVATGKDERTKMPDPQASPPSIGIEHVLYGIGMIEYHQIHEVFASILCEFLRTDPDEVESEGIAEAVLAIPCDERHPHCLRRNMLAISAVVKGNAMGAFSPECRGGFLHRLLDATKLAEQRASLSADAFIFFQKAIELSMDALGYMERDEDSQIAAKARTERSELMPRLREKNLLPSGGEIVGDD